MALSEPAKAVAAECADRIWTQARWEEKSREKHDDLTVWPYDEACEMVDAVRDELLKRELRYRESLRNIAKRYARVS